MYDLSQILYDYTVEVTNRFKGLDLVDKVPEKLWTEVHNTVQEVVTKIIPKKTNAKRQNSCLRRHYKQLRKEKKAKGKGEKERYTHLNAEFQGIAQKDKKAFLSDQCKEREENNRTGNTRDLFRKIRNSKGTFHAKMGTIKNRNCIDPTEAEDIKKR